jgi:SAM-dependent methyltransferase
MANPSNIEHAVQSRYSSGAQAREEALCCPVSFDPALLEVLPDEILERDYGCGDPTPFVRPGDTVLDLGCGAGKVCWIAAQIAGSEGRVIGVDMNTSMLALAEKHHRSIAERVGFDTVTFRRAMIQDLRLDLDQRPLVADESVDIVLSNCVLNLVRQEDKAQLFREIYRVVRDGGQVAVSDIVSDRDVPAEMQRDPELWSGCISGAFREDLFLRAFEECGFRGTKLVSRSKEPWRTVNGIEFRSVTVKAFKGSRRPEATVDDCCSPNTTCC